jgi:hypothetical protein
LFIVRFLGDFESQSSLLKNFWRGGVWSKFSSIWGGEMRRVQKIRQTHTNTDISRESSRGKKLGGPTRQLIIIICDCQCTLRATFCNNQTRKKSWVSVELSDLKFVTMLESIQEIQWKIQFQISSSTKLSQIILNFHVTKQFLNLQNLIKKANVFAGFTSKFVQKYIFN